MLPNKKQLQHLKALAHHLKPVIQIGQQGVTENVIAETDRALSHHELIKIKVSGSDRDIRAKSIEDVCEKTSAIVVQQIGSTAVLFRRNDKKPVVEFPSR